MQKILDVPFVSQFSIGRDPDGFSRSCGAACVKMVIDFKKGGSIDFQSVVDEGLAIRGAYQPPAGWTHSGITALLRNHDVAAYSQEFRSVAVDAEHDIFLLGPFEPHQVEQGIRKIAGEIEAGRPVIVSGIKNWREREKWHQMVITGVERGEGNAIKGFYYNDSEDEEKEGKNLFVDIDTFRNNWRKFAIFID